MAQEEEDAIVQLRRLVVDEEDLNVGTDRNTLLIFLCATDFDVEEAFEKMKAFFKAKLEYPEWFAHSRDPELHDAILKKGIHQLLDYRDQLGRRIYLLKLGNMTYGEFEPPQMFQTDDLWGLLAADEEETQRNGIVTIIDFAGMSWKFLKYYTPKNIRAASRKLENIPYRHYEFHVVNAGVILNNIVSLVYPFLNQRLKEKLHFHKSLESLHSQILPSCLPQEYGGEMPAVDSARLVKEYIDVRQARLSELMSYGYVKQKE